ncbi:DUF4142 domain-containing protein [Deinococcus sp.]|uniref:DUF4142 domain-containing protein n=1 Tax=Deinococcus sp. TaxID=47478 RepID=UPI003C7BB906
MNTRILMTALALGTTAAAAAMMLSSTDKAFVPRAAMGNQFEIEAAKLADSMSMDAKVKTYAQKMIADHTKLGADVKAAVMKADPSMMLPMSVSPAQQKMLDALKAAGKNFDGLYKKDMEASHAETYALFQKYSASADANAELKTVIKGALPTVKMHLDMAKTLPTMGM